MCGITGFIDNRPSRAESADQMHAVARKMASALVARGPDDAGTWVDVAAGIGLGFRRLAIVDLTPTGHQPMISRSGRYVMVFNGEIYNHQQLRRGLVDEQTTGEPNAESGDGSVRPQTQPAFRGRSDTEVLLNAIEQWGLEKALGQCVGMFAIALWDRRDRCLYLARDRLGEKPLYYGMCDNVFLFGSQLKSLWQHPRWSGKVDRHSVALYLRWNYVPAPQSIFEGIRKLPPGSYLKLPTDQLRNHSADLPAPRHYWSAVDAVRAGFTNPVSGSDDQLREQLEHLLSDAIGRQMMADVPLGAFLSGGVDSSTVVALMQAQASRPVRTFTIGFQEQAFDEAAYARRVARHLGTDHTELYVTPSQARDVIPLLGDIYDEPFADVSQIPTYLVCKLARQQVTVSLSGDGGDELFCGYRRYLLGDQIWRSCRRVPLAIRQRMRKTIAASSATSLNAGFAWLGPVFRRTGGRGPVSDQLRRLSDVAAAESPDEMYRRLTTHWEDVESIVQGTSGSLAVSPFYGDVEFTDARMRMMYFDMMTYLPDDILVKVDRASMGVSLECRAPFLDHRVMEFAWRLPMHVKVRHGKGKWLIRRILDKHVPREMIERPKMGFGVPIGQWLAGPLQDWAESLLDARRLASEGLLQPGPIRAKWDQHLRGQRDWQHQLWSVLMFQAWYETVRTAARRSLAA